MKLKWNGFDLELTVDELKQMVERGLIDPDDEKVPYPDTMLPSKHALSEQAMELRATLAQYLMIPPSRLNLIKTGEASYITRQTIKETNRFNGAS